MTSKFEQLIEYVINDEEAKAKELFHEFVVEKSREIYENLMNEEEAEDAEELDEADESEEDDEAEELDENFGAQGDASDELIDDVEMDEEGVAEGEEDEGDMGGDFADEGGSEEDLEDRVVDLEEKLDELMAEFEALMDKEEGDEDLGLDSGDELETDDTEEMDVEVDEMGMMEGVDLKSAPAPVKSEEASINKKSTVAANSGATGMDAKPVAAATGEEKGRPAPKAQDMGGTTSPKQGPATKPVTAQASGVNTKTPFPKA